MRMSPKKYTRKKVTQSPDAQDLQRHLRHEGRDAGDSSIFWWLHSNDNLQQEFSWMTRPHHGSLSRDRRNGASLHHRTSFKWRLGFRGSRHKTCTTKQQYRPRFKTKHLPTAYHGTDYCPSTYKSKYAYRMQWHWCCRFHLLNEDWFSEGGSRHKIGTTKQYRPIFLLHHQTKHLPKIARR